MLEERQDINVRKGINASMEANLCSAAATAALDLDSHKQISCSHVTSAYSFAT